MIHYGNTHTPMEVSRGFEPRSLDSGSRVLTVTPRDHLHESTALRIRVGARQTLCTFAIHPYSSGMVVHVAHTLCPCARLHRPMALSAPHTSLAPRIRMWAAHTLCKGRAHPRRCQEVSHGFEPRSLDSGSTVLTVTPRDHVLVSRPLDYVQ